jgi:putative membrane protein
MAGSLNKVWPWKNTTFTDRHDVIKPLVQENVLPHNYTGDPHLYGAILLALAGFALIFAIEWLATRKKV